MQNSFCLKIKYNERRVVWCYSKHFPFKAVFGDELNYNEIKKFIFIFIN